MRLTWTRAGTLLDTVGINAAPVGSFNVLVDANGNLSLQVYAPAHASPRKASNGWHVLPHPLVARAGWPCEVTLVRGSQQWRLTVAAGGQQQTATLPLTAPASGQPIYVGDFPGDNTWPVSLNPHRGLTGTVTLLGFTGRKE